MWRTLLLSTLCVYERNFIKNLQKFHRGAGWLGSWLVSLLYIPHHQHIFSTYTHLFVSVYMEVPAFQSIGFFFPLSPKTYISPHYGLLPIFLYSTPLFFRPQIINFQTHTICMEGVWGWEYLWCFLRMFEAERIQQRYVRKSVCYGIWGGRWFCQKKEKSINYQFTFSTSSGKNTHRIN